jgi:peptide/nickel transport system ATP-binding protein
LQLAKKDLLPPPPPAAASSSSVALSVRDLNVFYAVGEKGILLPAAKHVDFGARPGETIGILGESGAGKSTVAYAVMGLIEPPNRVSGEVYYNGRNVLTMTPREVRRYRWNEVAMVFQAAMNSLDPIITVGKNMDELLRDKGVAHGKEEARRMSKALLDKVDLAEEVYSMYPFELSGGMKQRVIIAMALATSPKILILDEPTTALDTITQFSVLSTIKTLKAEGRVGGMLLISHDISVQAFMVERLLVMLKGIVVEDAPVGSLVQDPKHPYSQVLTGKLKLETSADAGVKPSAKLTSTGCPFVPFCPYVMAKCREEVPPLIKLDGERRRVACYLYGG